LITVREAAARLGVTPRAVRALAQRGSLKGIKLGRDWLIREQAVAKRLKNKERRA